MEILIRQIARKGDSFRFKPHCKSGYKFNIEHAQPILTPFQEACIAIKPQNDRKLGSFWTPHFCYIGTLIAEQGQVSLKRMMSDNGDISLLSFNNNFPLKEFYFYKKARPHNLAVQTYFIGVRAVASLLSYYYDLQKTGHINEAALLYSKLLKPLGFGKLLADVDSTLVGSDDYNYIIDLSAKDCVIRSKNIEIDMSVAGAIKQAPKTVKKKQDVIVSQNQEQDVGDADTDDRPPPRPIKPLKLKNIVTDHKEDTEKVSEDKSNKRPFELFDLSLRGGK